MKRKYISPELVIEQVELQQFVCNSITNVSGDAGIGMGGDEQGTVAGDSRRHNNVWDDEEEEEQW